MKGLEKLWIKYIEHKEHYFKYFLCRFMSVDEAHLPLDSRDQNPVKKVDSIE